jgi:hypothetical protein
MVLHLGALLHPTILAAAWRREMFGRAAKRGWDCCAGQPRIGTAKALGLDVPATLPEWPELLTFRGGISVLL